MNLPFLKTSEMLELENHAIEAYGVTIDSMMQKAGKALYDLIKKEILKWCLERQDELGEDGCDYLEFDDISLKLL